jgi:hypothetical protein
MLNFLAVPVIILFQQGLVTFTGLEHIKGTDSLKVTVRLGHELFLRDYQQAVFDDLDLDDLRNFNPFPSDLANNYLNLKIDICANEKQVIGKLLKIEEVDGDIRFLILYRVHKKLKSITVSNTMLCGLSGKAQNYTIIRIGDYESSSTFTPVHTKETFRLKK